MLAPGGSCFWVDRTPITNAQFRRFVEATEHVTFCEIPPDPAQYPGAPATPVPGTRRDGNDFPDLYASSGSQQP